MRDRRIEACEHGSDVKWWSLIALAACGRVNFEPVTSEPVTDGVTAGTCGPAYADVAGSTSKYRRGSAADWFAAEADCESDGGHLVVIDDAAEQALVAMQIQGASIWIGLSDHASEGTMVWVTGEPLVFDAFSKGEPNDANGIEDCVQISDDQSRVWNDKGCRAAVFEYVCECDQRPVAQPQTYCDTELAENCGECGAVCTDTCANQVCVDPS